MTPAEKFIEEEKNVFVLNHKNYIKTKDEKVRIIWGDEGWISMDMKLLSSFIGGLSIASILIISCMATGYESIFLLLIFPLVSVFIYYLLSLNNGDTIMEGIHRNFKETILNDDKTKSFLSSLNKKTKDIYLKKWNEEDYIYLYFKDCYEIAEEDARITRNENILESLH